MKNILAEIFGNKKERTDFLISIFVILIVISSVVYYVFRPGNALLDYGQMAVEIVDSKDEVLVKKKLDELAQAVTVDEKLEETESDSKSIFDKARKQQTAAAAAIINPNNSTEIEEEAKEDLIPEVEAVPEVIPKAEVLEEETSAEFEESTSAESKEEAEEMDEPIISEDSLSKEDQKAIINEAGEEVEDTITADPKEYNVSPSDEKITDDKNEPSNIIEENNYGCIVIIGAFKERKNADKLQARIKNKAYPVYSGINKGYFVVGVNTSCDRKISIPLLKKLKKEFKTNAWIFKR